MNTEEKRLSVVAIVGCDDHGAGDAGRGSTSCPHCGAEGRYVYHCIMNDGSMKSMMKGCLHTFSRSSIAGTCEAVMRKKAEGKHLGSWDQELIKAIESFLSGQSSYFELKRTCERIAVMKKNYRRSRFH